ncbi:MAG TPA: hypothetical protein DCY94_02935, partial [Firmicutes bacterium]|nr:hypothetical protein [Bacillota bacterium]
KRNLKSAKVFIVSCALFCVALIGIVYNINLSYAQTLENVLIERGNVSGQIMYLSDLTFTKAQVGWGNVSLDKTQSNTPLTLVVNGASTVFKKGIWAHATSTIEYDISEYKDYAYLTTYYGLNTTAQNTGNGVKFYIYTSVDGVEWTLKTEENPTALKGVSEAGYAKVDIRGANYIRLYANDCGSNASDHAIWADSKLVKDGYSDDIMIGLDKFDSYIKANYKGGEVKPELRLAVLQRNLLYRIGQYQLRQFVDSDPKHKETFEWFIYNEEALRLWTIGGTPNGSYTRALEVLSNLYQAHKEDLENENTTSNGTKYKDLYLKMMLALSLTHSSNIGLWIGGNQFSDAVTRYEIYKQMHLDNKLLSNSVFENLTVEEMRWVMHVNIDDEEILWFRDYSAKRYPDLVQRFSPYGYVRYTKGYGYYRPQYYSQENYAKWDQKYNLSKYNITYQAGKPKLWIVFEEGAVCGGISKTAANLYGVWGMPASVVGQPGHAAYIYYYDVGGKGAWQLSYNVAATGWANTSGYSRMPNDWGNLGSGVVTDTANIKSASYFFLAQEAQNEYEKYEKAKMILLLENIYKDDTKKLMKIYRDALEQERINWYAWLGIVNLYLKDTSKTQKDLIDLAEEIAEAIPYHPLPMYDLTRRIGTKITSPEHKAQLMMIQEKTLRKATKATAANTLQYKEVPVVAQALLGEIDPEIATFSFNGANAKKITLSKQLQSTQVSWSYSLDGGRTWKDCYDHSVELTDEEIASIDINNDIKIHISGLDYSAANIYTIDITKRSFPSGVITINDEENRILGATNDMEWTLDPNAGWNSFANTNPIFSGNTRAYVRVTAAGTQLASDPVYFTFKENNVDATKWYIQAKNLNAYEVNASQTGFYNRQNVLDGNIKTSWRSKYGILPAYVAIESDIPRYISGIDYAPDPSAKKFDVIPFGRAKKLNVYVSMDKVNWDLAATKDNLGDNDNIKHIDFPEPRKAKYVKVECVSIYSGDYTTFTVSIIKLYENVAVDETPRAEINYNIVRKTNQDVVAELVNPTRNITVTNNGGKMTHTFTENGEFTFEFKDVDGNTGTATATVDWIDKKKPTANVTFNTTQITNEEVVATLTFDKEVTILSKDVQVAENEDHSQTITFLENGEVELKFQDSLGNIGTKLIKVDWIDNVDPTAEIEYSTITLTDKEVTAKLKPSEQVTILNNGGSDTYTFLEDGTFTFEFVDRAGNKGTATASVDWIAKVPKYEISYSTKELTNKDVTATVTLEGGYRIVNNDAKNVYTFTDNGTFEFQYIDNKNHVGLIMATVDWIDKIAPTAELKYTYGNGKVIVTVVNPSEEITFKEGKGTYEYTENGTYEIIFYDKVGNEGKLSAVVEIKKDEEEKPTEPEKPEEGNKPDEGDKPSGDDKPSDEKPTETPKPDTKPTNPNKPSTGNTTKPSNPNTSQKPEEKPEEKPTETEYKKYEAGKIKVEIPSTALSEDGTLRSEEFKISDDMKNKFGNASEYYELYFTNAESKKININSSEAIKMNIKIDSSKELLGIYEITEANVIKSIDYAKNGEDIVFKANSLGKFVVSYKEKETNNSTETLAKKVGKMKYKEISKFPN